MALSVLRNECKRTISDVLLTSDTPFLTRLNVRSTLAGILGAYSPASAIGPLALESLCSGVRHAAYCLNHQHPEVDLTRLRT
jgi:hypothetical protein